MDLVGQEGELIDSVPLVALRRIEKFSTWFLTFRTTPAKAPLVAGARTKKPLEAIGKPCANPAAMEEEAVLCRCERVKLGEVVDFIRENQVLDSNQLKSLRVGMGACGGKTCSQLLPIAFRLAGIDPGMVEPDSNRPLSMEVPMGQIVNEGLSRLGGKDSGSRGAP
jgi:hypothetical protein